MSSLATTRIQAPTGAPGGPTPGGATPGGAHARGVPAALAAVVAAGRTALAGIDSHLSLLPRAIIAVYRRLLSPALPASCRFYPSCSAYADEAYRVHGFGRGSVLTLWRLSRCHPWCEGGCDSVPEVATR